MKCVVAFVLLALCLSCALAHVDIGPGSFVFVCGQRENGEGVIGPIFANEPRFYFYTNGHVLARSTKACTRAPNSHHEVEIGRTIASLESAHFDFALVVITNEEVRFRPTPYVNWISDSKEALEIPGATNVQLISYPTGHGHYRLIAGQLLGLAADVHTFISGHSSDFTGFATPTTHKSQYIIQAADPRGFGFPGDSGGLVMDSDQNLIGLYWGANSDIERRAPAHRYGFVTPMALVVEATIKQVEAESKHGLSSNPSNQQRAIFLQNSAKFGPYMVAPPELLLQLNEKEGKRSNLNIRRRRI